jgi:hypothetical protein
VKLQQYEISRKLRKDTSLLDFINDVTKIINLGRYQMRIITSVPTHTGDDGEHSLYISGKIKRVYFYDPTNSAWNYLTPMVATASLTGQTAAIGATTLFTPSAVGTYRVSVYQVITKAGTGGTLATTIGWTDNEQAQTSKPASDLDMTSLGAASSGVLFIQATAVAITYTTTTAGIAGAPEYDCYLTVEQLS